MIWINGNLKLKGNLVEIISLDSSHFEELILLSKDRRIWEHYAIDGSETKKLKACLEDALIEKQVGTQYPFVIKALSNGSIIGSTRLLDIRPEHKKLEIGWTWLHPLYWGSKINIECKYLLLSYCFENMGALRVQLKTDENNVRSRRAIEKIGGLFEGILRNDMVRDDLTKRNSAYYSVIDVEWTKTKRELLKLLNK